MALLLLAGIEQGFSPFFKKMPHWIKFSYERNTYLVNLNSVSAFALASNGRLSFWLPNRKNSKIVLNPKLTPEAYRQVLEYIQKTL